VMARAASPLSGATTPSKTKRATRTTFQIPGARFRRHRATRRSAVRTEPSDSKERPRRRPPLDSGRDHRGLSRRAPRQRCCGRRPSESGHSPVTGGVVDQPSRVPTEARKIAKTT
jgi:hypothetical protein